MASAWHLSLSLLHWVTLVQSFNMDTKHPTIIHGEIASHFGYKVLQFGSEKDPGILVSAPLERNTTENVTGALYKCDYHSRACHPIPIPGRPESQIDGVGLSLAVDPRTPSKLLLCAPSLSYSCGLNKYLNGICYQFDSSLALSRNFTPAFQGCPEKELDVAFLIDGSGSISASDFTKMKRFMLKVMELLKGEQVQFAVAQYSDETRKEFNFRDYRKSPHPWVLIEPIEQMNSITFTPSGIKFVAEKIFREDQGARTTATWVMIVITDGESNDVDVTFPDAIAAAKKKNILRYAIGVGDAFSTQRATEELNIIASKPSVDFVLKVNNFAALENINEKLKEKIFAIEGTGNSSGKSSFHLEMAQAGFSAIFEEDAIVLGAVGANDWSGALVKVQDGQEEVIQDSTLKDMAESYLGYSIVKARLGSQSFSVVGAPRYKHRGQVVIFGPGSNRTKWEVKQRIEGDQIGSYFGVELSSVDLDGDGETDFLLIGAPLYHKSGIGGRVSFCPLSAQGNFSCTGTLRGVEGNGLGRFGSAIAALRDLNGDGLGDVAIGAPLEDEHRGSVYIYHGQPRGISPRYSQRVEGRRYFVTPRYFGLSISGVMDVSGDSLTDLVVGGLGTVAVFRSRPILNVSVSIVFDPEEIPHAVYECHGTVSPNRPVGNATVCFRVAKLSADTLGKLRANVTYTLLLDTGCQKARVTFRSSSRRLARSLQVFQGLSCRRHQIILPSCVKDYFVPIELSMNYTLAGQIIEGSRGLRPVLNEYSETQVSAKLPFQMDCSAVEGCEDDLRVVFNFSGGDSLVVGSDTLLTASVLLDNAKEDSYKTRLNILHPVRLSFKKITAVQPSSVHIECDVVQCPRDPGTGSMSCSVGHPIFHRAARVTFNTVFDISTSGGEEQTARMSINATSENPRRITNESSFTRTLRLRYAIHLAASGLGYTRNVNFTAGRHETRLVKHSYQVENLSWRSLPISVAFTVPVKVGARSLWNVTVSERKPGNRSVCQPAVETTPSVKREAPKDRPDHAVLDCGIVLCVMLRCSVGLLEDHGAVIFDVQGELKSPAVSELNLKKMGLPSKVLVSYDEVKYVDLSEGADRYKEATLVTEVEILDRVKWLPLILGSSVGGLILLLIMMVLLYKLGFFKRNFDSGDGDAPEAKTSEGGESPEGEEEAASE